MVVISLLHHRRRPTISAQPVARGPPRVHSTGCVPPGATTSTVRARAAERAAATAARTCRSPTTRSGRRRAPRSGCGRDRRARPRRARRWCLPGRTDGRRASPRCVAAARRSPARGRRTADCRRGARPRDALAADLDLRLANLLGRSHRRAKRAARPCARSSSVSTLGPASVSMVTRVAGAAARALTASQAPTQRTPLPESSERLPSALNSRMRAPVGRLGDEHQPVGADAAVTIARAPRQVRQIVDGGDISGRRRSGSRCRTRAP